MGSVKWIGFRMEVGGMSWKMVVVAWCASLVWVWVQVGVEPEGYIQRPLSTWGKSAGVTYWEAEDGKPVEGVDGEVGVEVSRGITGKPRMLVWSEKDSVWDPVTGYWVEGSAGITASLGGGVATEAAPDVSVFTFDGYVDEANWSRVFIGGSGFIGTTSLGAGPNPKPVEIFCDTQIVSGPCIGFWVGGIRTWYFDKTDATLTAVAGYGMAGVNYIDLRSPTGANPATGQVRLYFDGATNRTGGAGVDCCLVARTSTGTEVQIGNCVVVDGVCP